MSTAKQESKPSDPKVDWRTMLMQLPGSAQGGLSYEQKMKIMEIFEAEQQKYGYKDIYAETVISGGGSPWLAIRALKLSALGYSEEGVDVNGQLALKHRNMASHPEGDTSNVSSSEGSPCTERRMLQHAKASVHVVKRAGYRVDS